MDIADPRVRMAAERTFLAWIRTSLAVTSLGFVLARHDGPSLVSTFLGVGLMLLGSASVGFAAWQYGRLFGGLDPHTVPEHQLAIFSVGFAATLAVIGLILAGTLLVRAVADPPRTGSLRVEPATVESRWAIRGDETLRYQDGAL